MEHGRITKKGQITIPQKFREILGIKAGEKSEKNYRISVTNSYIRTDLFEGS